MKLRTTLLAAAAAALAAAAGTAARAAPPTVTPYALTDANKNIQNECTVVYNGNFYPCSMHFGWDYVNNVPAPFGYDAASTGQIVKDPGVINLLGAAGGLPVAPSNAAQAHTDAQAAVAALSPSGGLPVSQADQQGTVSSFNIGSVGSASALIPLTAGRGAVGITTTGLGGSGATVVLQAQNGVGGAWATVACVVPQTGQNLASLSGASDVSCRVNAAGHDSLRFLTTVAATSPSATMSAVYTATVGDGVVTEINSATIAAADQTTATNTASPLNIAPGQANVTTSAAVLVAARTGRRSVTVYNTGSAAIYVGPSGVTTGTGFPVPPGGNLTLTFAGALYAVSGSTSAVSFYELY